MHELQVMNVQMRIITDENVDQLLSMSYSNNINKLMKSDKNIKELIDQYTIMVRKTLSEKSRKESEVYDIDSEKIPSPAQIETPTSAIDQGSPQYNPNAPFTQSEGSPQYNPNASFTSDPGSPQYNPNAQGSPQYETNVPYTPPGTPPTGIQRFGRQEPPQDSVINSVSNFFSDIINPVSPPSPSYPSPSYPSPSEGSSFKPIVFETKTTTPIQSPPTDSILNVEKDEEKSEEKEEEKEEKEETDNKSETKKIVTFNTNEN
jgi:hypothetical protein